MILLFHDHCDDDEDGGSCCDDHGNDDHDQDADEDLLQELKSLDSVLGEGQPLFRVLPPSQHDDDRDHDGADDDDDEKSQCPMAQMMGNDSMMMIRIIML